MRHQFTRGSLLLYPAYVQDYLDRVTATDVTAGNSSGLESGVTDATSSFLQDLVSISYLGISGGVISQAASVIKASCIMAGAHTRQGSLVPVVGPAPTEFGTAGGWNYNRKTGTAGNGINNYLNSNRNNNADPQNSNHNAVYATSLIPGIFMGAGGPVSGGNSIGTTLRNRSNISANGDTVVGLNGATRSSSASFSNTLATFPIVSEPPFNGDVLVFARGTVAAPNTFNASRIAFYSIGESLDLALLDASVTALINAYAAAIP
jgi:hypothetical protein